MRRAPQKLVWLATGIAALAFAPQAAADPLVVRKAMEDEMARSLSDLRLGASAPPYYLRYTVVDTERGRVSARLGALVEDDQNRARTARIDARVGSADEDNTNFVGFGGGGSSAGVSQEDDYRALRRDLWILSDREYKGALETLARKKASHAVQAADKDKLPDFAPAAPLQKTLAPASLPPETHARLQALATSLSRVFREYPTVNNAVVAAGFSVTRRRLLTSEKTWADESSSHVEVEVSADTVAEDGQRLASSLRFTAVDVAGLPPDATMQAEARALAQNLAAQRTAKAVEPGSATVLFEGQAAAELARLLFGTPLSGQPVPRSAGETPRDGSASFADKFGLRVAPTWLSVTDDPLALGPAKRALFGSYHVDDEGVAAERVTLIDHGVVKGLLMSRTPRKEIARSNGHGRGDGAVRGAAASLFVNATGGLGRAELLAAAVRSAGPNGTVYVVRELGDSSGLVRGQTLDARVAVQWKAGKEEVVRGLSLEGFTPKKLKKDLIAAGRELVVLDEPYGSPTSVVTPALLFEDVDVGKPNDKNRRPPLYPSPLAESAH